MLKLVVILLAAVAATPLARAQSGQFLFDPNETDSGAWVVVGLDRYFVHEAWTNSGSCEDSELDEDLYVEWPVDDGIVNAVRHPRAYNLKCELTIYCDPLQTDQSASADGIFVYAIWSDSNTISFAVKFSSLVDLQADDDLSIECEPNSPKCCFLGGGTSTSRAQVWDFKTNVRFDISAAGYVHVQAGRATLDLLGDDDIEYATSQVELTGPGLSDVEQELIAGIETGYVDEWGASRVIAVDEGSHLFFTDFYCNFIETVSSGESLSDSGGGMVYVTLRYYPDDTAFFEYGDVDGDGDTDLADLSDVLDSLGTCATDSAFDPRADFDGSGCVDLADLSLTLEYYGD